MKTIEKKTNLLRKAVLSGSNFKDAETKHALYNCKHPKICVDKSKVYFAFEWNGKCQKAFLYRGKIKSEVIL